jgi:hypothetical protein
MLNIVNIMSVTKTTAPMAAGDDACVFLTGTKTPLTTTKTKRS